MVVLKNNVYFKLIGSFDMNFNGTKKKFKTADAAINYALNMIPNAIVQEEIIKSTTSIEYVISQTKRFTIIQCSL